VIGRDGQRGADVAAEVERRGRRALSVVADVTKPADVERAVASCVSSLGRLDVLVNNAGVAIHRPAMEVPDEEWDSVLDLNLTALWRCSRAAARTMIEQGGGSS
jgi:NAD(P)-dependent dehydrogenase (short-subunit alcohol dehydrogenase family)